MTPGPVGRAGRNKKTVQTELTPGPEAAGVTKVPSLSLGSHGQDFMAEKSKPACPLTWQCQVENPAELGARAADSSHF